MNEDYKYCIMYIYCNNCLVRNLIISFNSKEFLSGMWDGWTVDGWMAFPNNNRM